MLTDTHCHIADMLFDADRELVIERAQQAGVTTLVEIAESPESWERALALADRYSFIYVSLGVHPHHAHEISRQAWPAVEARLRELLRHPKVVALGEFGLDYFKMRNTKEDQAFIFQAQLRLARELKKPVVIHCRDAHADAHTALAEFFSRGPSPATNESPAGVIHCFTGTYADAQRYLDLGFFLGIDAPLTYPSATQLKENVQRLPLECLVLETDSPYLPPQPQRGQRNEPAHVRTVAEAVAALQGKPFETVARQTSRNARALFRL